MSILIPHECANSNIYQLFIACVCVEMHIVTYIGRLYFRKISILVKEFLLKNNH